MPINAHPEYMQAEGKYQQASTNEERVAALEEMIKWAPKHKGGETLRKNLKARYKKLKQELAKSKKKAGGKKGIKKAELQAVLVGLTNSGKSSILNAITNAQSRIASYGFTTLEPEIGTLNYGGCDIQIIDMPPIASEAFNKSIVNSADTILLVVERVDEIPPVLELIKQNKDAKKIVVFNKIDNYDENTKRKISETLKSKKYNFVLTSAITDEGMSELKEKIFQSFPIIRVYTKHPGKSDKSDTRPVVLPIDSTLEEVAEKILHGYSKKVKYAKVTGPSAKFKDQKIGLKHVVKDRDVVEFVTE